MMNELSVIIVFLNEGIEIERTLNTVRQTAGAAVDIVLINDASTDGYDYASVAQRYNASYYINPTRMGPACARDKGISVCTTPYFLLLDGHMRLYDNDWWSVITAYLHQNDRAIYCCQCKVLDNNFQIMRDRDTFGAYIQWDGTDYGNTLKAAWNSVDDHTDPDTMVIPCILGACYAASKRYWTYLKGYTGLILYGCEEPYISIKAWLEGGKCILLKNIEIGHIFRDEFPYAVDVRDVLYNKLVIAATVLSPSLKARIFSILQKTCGKTYQDAFERLIQNKNELMKLQLYYRQIFTRQLDLYLAFNQTIASKS